MTHDIDCLTFCCKRCGIPLQRLHRQGEMPCDPDRIFDLDSPDQVYVWLDGGTLGQAIAIQQSAWEDSGCPLTNGPGIG